MSVTVREGRRQRTHVDYRRITKGYAASRQAYDKRRRQRTYTQDDKTMMDVLRGDPCSFCGGRSDRERMAVDHIVALENGGTDDWTNMAAICRPCNASKKNRSVLDFMLRRYADDR